MQYQNPLSGITSSPILQDGKLVMREVQPGKYPAAARIASAHQNDIAKPLIGNTQRHLRHVAEIPMAVVNQLIRDGIWGDEKAFRKWLDGDGKAWKSYPGTVS